MIEHARLQRLFVDRNKQMTVIWASPALASTETLDKLSPINTYILTLGSMALPGLWFEDVEAVQI